MGKNSGIRIGFSYKKDVVWSPCTYFTFELRSYYFCLFFDVKFLLFQYYNKETGKFILTNYVCNNIKKVCKRFSREIEFRLKRLCVIAEEKLSIKIKEQKFVFMLYFRYFLTNRKLFFLYFRCASSISYVVLLYFK